METDYKSIDQYIASFPLPTRKLLEELRSAIRGSAPLASEKISYQIPTFFQNGNLVHFAAFAKHIGFYPGASAIRTFALELENYKTSTGTVQFPIEKPMPLNLVRKIVEFRVEENSAKAKKK